MQKTTFEDDLDNLGPQKRGNLRILGRFRVPSVVFFQGFLGSKFLDGFLAFFVEKNNKHKM